MKKFVRGLLAVAGGLLIIIAVLYLLRYPIMRSAGNYLITEQPMEQVDAIFVLSGAPADRGKEGARLYKDGYSPVVVTTGELIPQEFYALDMDYPEAKITAMNMQRNGVPDSAITQLYYGTSTQEEGDTLLPFCKARGWDKIAVVTHKFHTRRAGKVFVKPFAQEGIEVIMRGAPSSAYNEATWWENEYGMIFVNNEYMKLLYYALK